MLNGKIIQCVIQRNIRHTTYENSMAMDDSYVMDFIGTYANILYQTKKKKNIRGR